MSTQLTAPQAIQWDDETLVNTIKETVCKGATPAQFRMFLEVCKATRLNPFLKEIWFVPAVGVMAGRDGYLRVANEHPQFDGMSTTVERDEKGIPLKATCSVWRKDRGHPITCEAWYSEYRKNSNVWQTYPSAMISKVAEVLALKRSFAINGIVTEEEIGEQKAQAQDAQNEVRDRKIKELNDEAEQRRIKEVNSFVVRKIEPISEARMAELQAEGKAQAQEDFKNLSPATIIELANSLDQAPEPTYEQREQAKQQEAIAAMGKEFKQQADKVIRKKGDISFKALGEIKALKTVIRGITSNDDKYYELLGVFGVKHADELSLADGRKFYKALLAIPNALKQDEALLLEVKTHALRIGPYATQAALERRGLKSIEEVLQVPNGTELDALLKELRETA